MGPTFTCLDGSSTFPIGRVNDNYCDCLDGSDEPGTPACSNAHYYCANVGYLAKSVSSSLVWDGVCDCCDGSDEQSNPAAGSGGAAASKCRNTCESDGASWRVAREEAQRRVVEGVKARRGMVEAASAAASERGASLAKAREQLEGAKRAVDAATEALSPITAREDAANEGAKVAAEADGGLRVLEEAFGTGALDRSALLDVLITTTKDSSTQTALCDTLKAKAGAGLLPGVASDFAPAFPGEAQNVDPTPTDLAHTLGISGLDRTALLLLLHAHAKSASASPQLLDALRHKGIPNPQWKEDPVAFTRVELEEGKVARETLSKAKSEESAAQGEVTRLEGEATTDFGPGGAFFPLKGQCFDLRFQQYTYTMCPFGAARQDSTTLGSFTGWGSLKDGSGVDYGEMLFTGGSHCWNGPARSLKARFECGPETKLLAVE